MSRLQDNIQTKSVLVEYTFRKIKGVVYWYYRFHGQRAWTKQKTPYKDIPFIKANWGDFTK